MQEFALRAIRHAIHKSPTGFHEVSADIFGASPKALDALHGLLGVLHTDYPDLRFEITASSATLQSLGLTTGYIMVRSDLIFIRLGERDAPGFLRLRFEPRT